MRNPKLAWLFAGAFALRLVALLVLAPHHAAQDSTAWNWGHEAACLGESISLGQGLADPWAHGTGPSGWLTPPYPALIALLMKVFGGVNPAMAFSLYTLQAGASAAICVLLVRLGENLSVPRAGWWGGVLFAIYPLSLWYAISEVWDTTFVAAGLLACLVALTRPVPMTQRRIALLGLGWGALTLLNPAPLAILPAVLTYLWMPMGSWGERLRSAALFGVCLLAVCAPWMLRNWRVLGTPGLRPNFGVELHVGNNPESNGHPQPFKFHPSHVAAELALYRELGEVGYSSHCRVRATEWIRSEPRAFLALTARRVQYFWLGDLPLVDQRRSSATEARHDPNAWAKFLSFASLGVLGWLGALFWRGSRRDQILLIGILVCFGLAYYVTHVSERYRFPIDPLLALLAATFLLDRIGKSRVRAPAP